MKSLGLIEELGCSTRRFYKLRQMGLIPPPQTGDGVRKFYSPAEVLQVKKKLKSLGIVIVNLGK